MVKPASRRMSTSRVASAASISPNPLNARLSAESGRPETEDGDFESRGSELAVFHGFSRCLGEESSPSSQAPEHQTVTTILPICWFDSR